MRAGKSKSKGSQYHEANAHAFGGIMGNMSLFEYFTKGCFSKQESYCPNRLTDYYCVIWTNMSEVGQANSSYVPLSKIQYDFDECGGDFTAEWIQIFNLCFLPLLLAFGLISNLFLCYVASQFAGKQLPICYYISLLAFLDFSILWLRAGDLWIQSLGTGSISLNYIVLIINRSSCQLYTATYSFLTHLKSCLHMALAIDTWRFVRDPIKTISFYTSEWIANSIILICVLLVPINCQFVWTFDVVRQSVSNSVDGLFFCSFAVKWPVDERFSAFLWPLIDLIIGDLLPQINVFIFVLMSVISIYCRQFVKLSLCNDDLIRKGEADNNSNKIISGNREKMAKYILNVDLFVEVRKALLILNIIYILFLFPTMIHNISMYWPYATYQWSALSTGGGKDSIEFSTSAETYKETQNSMAAIETLHERKQTRLLFVKLLALVQLIVNPVVFFIFVTTFRLTVKNFFLKLFNIKCFHHLKKFNRLKEYRRFTQQAQRNEKSFNKCTSV